MVCHFSEETLRTLARSIEYYFDHYVDKELAKADNAAASAEDFRLREVRNALGLERFFDVSTLMRF